MNKKELSWSDHSHSGYATTSELNEVKTSVSSGKALIAAAVTDKGVQTAATDSFQTIASNIENLPDGEPNIVTLVVYAPSGSTVTVSSSGRSFTTEEVNSTWTFGLPFLGTFNIYQEYLGENRYDSVDCAVAGQIYYMDFSDVAPEFTYTGSYQLVNDDDSAYSGGNNWKIRFLTSGTFTITNLRGAYDGIDVFLVGGGGGAFHGGGGGGYTRTQKNVAVSSTSYSITVGNGGVGKWVKAFNGDNTDPTDGSSSSAFGYTAAGGKKGTQMAGGGAGGSGGGGNAYSYDHPGGNGGSNGGNGSSSDRNGGKGQISTAGPNGETGNTYEFGETSSGKLYAGGGGGTSYDTVSYTGGLGGAGGGGNAEVKNGRGSEDGTPNTGGGGGGGPKTTSYPQQYGSGGSGIVIIRNTR